MSDGNTCHFSINLDSGFLVVLWKVLDCFQTQVYSTCYTCKNKVNAGGFLTSPANEDLLHVHLILKGLIGRLATFILSGDPHQARRKSVEDESGRPDPATFFPPPQYFLETLESIAQSVSSSSYVQELYSARATARFSRREHLERNLDCIV